MEWADLAGQVGGSLLEGWPEIPYLHRLRRELVYTLIVAFWNQYFESAILLRKKLNWIGPPLIF